MKKIKILRKDVPIRMILFFFIGVIYVLYFFVSLIFFEKLANSSLLLVPVFMLFPIFYLIVNLLFLVLIKTVKRFYRYFFGIIKKEDKSKKDYIGEKLEIEGMLSDVAGFYIGSAAAFFLVVIVAIIFIFILVIKGIIWLIHNPNPWGILAIILLIASFSVYISQRLQVNYIDLD